MIIVESCSTLCLVLSTVSDGDRLTFGRLQVTVYETPGHTLGHVVYLIDGSQFGAPSNLFSGDHLFIGGIGKYAEFFVLCFRFTKCIKVRFLCLSHMLP